MEWKLLSYVERKNNYTRMRFEVILMNVVIVGVVVVDIMAELSLGDVEFIGEMLPKFL